MPPRKSNVSTASNGAEDGADTAPARSHKEGMSVEDLSLPKSMIARLAKGVLPPNTQIHKDALLALHKSATVFVSYIASNSSETAQAGGKKTISPQDVMACIKDAELEEFLPRLEAELKRYNDIQCDKRNSYRHRVKQEKAAAATTTRGDEAIEDIASAHAPDSQTNHHIHDDEAERPVKKLKGDSGEAIAPNAEGMDENGDGGAQDADETEEPDEDDDGEDVADDEPEEDEDAGDDDEAEEDTDEVEVRGGVRDEALDDVDSD